MLQLELCPLSHVTAGVVDTVSIQGK